MKRFQSLVRMVLQAACLLWILAMSPAAVSQALVLNEIMPANKTALSDEDGETPDWIELYNFGSTEINLEGFGLTDDSSDLFKWTFPAVTIGPGQYSVIFASGKNRTATGQVWETVVDWGDTWKYFTPTEALPVNWRLPGFDDSGWMEGPSGFGYGDGDDATYTGQVMSVYIRKSFSAADLPQIIRAVLHVDYDDGFVAYLNGNEIARANLGTPGTFPGWDEAATSIIEPSICYGGYPFAFEISPSAILPGDNILAIEVHNSDPGSSDLSLIPFLSLLLESAPPNPGGTPEILRLQNPNLHTNFRIKSTGEKIILTNAIGLGIDSMSTGRVYSDISIGRQPDGSGPLKYFTSATPGSPNTFEGWPGITEPVAFSHPAGFYASSFWLTLSTSHPDDVIHYTLDGSEPTTQSAIYHDPLFVPDTRVVRALAYNPIYLPGQSSTATFIIGNDHDIAVVSLATDPENLFDPVTGIYHDNNIWEDWERPIHVEFFDTDDTSGFSLEAGVKIYGGWTRTLPQKSLAIFARESYGFGEIDYPIFPALDFTKFESFVLRNSGNDWQVTMMRDELMTGLADDLGVDVQASRPAAVYINGEYWGLYYIREKLNERYIESHYGVNPDSLDLLELEGVPLAGNAMNYSNLINFIENNPPADPANYQHIRSQMDVENFMTYEIAQIFFCNTDWPGNNIKYWRSWAPGGKWKWMLYDTDFGFGLATDYTHNTLEFATDPYSTNWPNPAWSTFLLRKLLTNEEFRVDFINRYADLLNSNFLTNRMQLHITQRKQAVISEMPRQFARWGSNMWEWVINTAVLSEFASERRTYAQSHVVNYFGLPEYSGISVNLLPAGSGTVNISTLHLTNFPWTGEYFNGVPVELNAKGSPGYRFIGWQGSFPSTEPDITVTFSQTSSLTAVFESYTPDPIVINEINYNSPDEFNPEDWLELYNPGPGTVDLEGWILQDDDSTHSFVFPESTLIEPNGYLVVCRDTSLFRPLFPDSGPIMGNLDFGLSGGGDMIRLFDFSGLLIDSVSYDDEDPWPWEPDGYGPTLELIDPELDNALAENWLAFNEHGTPGALNGPFTRVPEAGLPDDIRIRVFPNPFSSSCRITIGQTAPAELRLDIVDATGRSVKILFDGLLPAGKSEISWIPDGLPQGIYLVRAVTDREIRTTKLILDRN